MKMLIKLFFTSSLFIASVLKAQQPTIKPIDINLENYQYPYLVQYITLNIQSEALKMEVTHEKNKRF